MAVLQVEVVVRTIEVGWHHGDIVGAILQVVALTHLQASDLGDGILLVGIFQRRSQEHVLRHWLGSILGIDAGGTEEEQLLHAMRISIADDVALHLHVLHDKVSTIERVSHNATHESSSQNHSIRTLLIEELLHGILVSKVKLLMRTTHQIVIPSLLKVIPYSRTHQSMVSRNINL